MMLPMAQLVVACVSVLRNTGTHSARSTAQPLPTRKAESYHRPLTALRLHAGSTESFTLTGETCSRLKLAATSHKVSRGRGAKRRHIGRGGGWSSGKDALHTGVALC